MVLQKMLRPAAAAGSAEDVVEQDDVCLPLIDCIAVQLHVLQAVDTPVPNMRGVERRIEAAKMQAVLSQVAGYQLQAHTA
jgi:hypothetical protein